jgi:hypothetical protein
MPNSRGLRSGGGHIRRTTCMAVADARPPRSLLRGCDHSRQYRYDLLKVVAPKQGIRRHMPSRRHRILPPRRLRASEANENARLFCMPTRQLCVNPGRIKTNVGLRPLRKQKVDVKFSHLVSPRSRSDRVLGVTLLHCSMGKSKSRSCAVGVREGRESVCFHHQKGMLANRIGMPPTIFS